VAKAAQIDAMTVSFRCRGAIPGRSRGRIATWTPEGGVHVNPLEVIHPYCGSAHHWTEPVQDLAEVTLRAVAAKRGE